MIKLSNVSKSYPLNNGFRHVLRDVSLVIPDRTNIAVLGPNGAGKSTFLRIIGGAEQADSGSIVTDSDISWPLGLNSGFQGSLTGRQNVLFVCQINGLSGDQSRQVTNQVVAFAEIGDYFDMPVSTYSSGMRARLSFGLSMSFKFDIYLIDELTSVGDVIFREKAKSAFEQIRARASLIFVSHNLSVLRAACDSALFLRDGEADFYPDINDGIRAYKQYIGVHRDDKNLKRAHKVALKAARQRRRLAREAAEAETTTTPAP